jgi:hypothetical protein
MCTNFVPHIICFVVRVTNIATIPIQKVRQVIYRLILKFSVLSSWPKAIALLKRNTDLRNHARSTVDKYCRQ